MKTEYVLIHKNKFHICVYIIFCKSGLEICRIHMYMAKTRYATKEK